MKLIRIIALTIFFTSLIFDSIAQNNRASERNNIGWYNYSGNFKLNKYFGLYSEYQFRRDNFITKWQQSVLKVGVNYYLNPRVLLRAGYGFIETFPYGDTPLNSMGRKYAEHRIFEMAQLTQKEGIVEISHRFMLEQRFVGKYSSTSVAKEDLFPETNRVRYMLKLQIPLKGKEIKDKTPYLALYDELFVGFGKNVNQNVFDQNRLGVLLGYRVNKKLRLEAGYLNQTQQYGRLVNTKNLFQINNGIIVNANFNFDFSKK